MDWGEAAVIVTCLILGALGVVLVLQSRRSLAPKRGKRKESKPSQAEQPASHEEKRDIDGFLKIVGGLADWMEKVGKND